LTAGNGLAVARRAAFGAGLFLSLLMVWRSQVGGDQLNLLARGWLLAAEGRLVPYGNPLSSGGNAPGAITGWLVGAPLQLWRDHRAPALSILLLHVAAYAILDAIVRRRLGARGRLLFAVFYWLNPWRLYHSAFVWNPNYLFFFAAVHLGALLAQREAARWWASTLLVASIGLAFQVHPSAILLAALAGLLWLRGFYRLHWGGVALGLALACLPLVPWLLAGPAPPNPQAPDRGFPGRGLIYVWPMLRGHLDWLRYGGLAIGGKAARFDFGALGGAWNAWLGPLARGLSAVGFFTALAALAANRREIGRALRRGLRPAPPVSGRGELREIAAVGWVAAGLVFAASPTTIMNWQGLVLLHVAILPVVLWAEGLWRLHPRAGARLGALVAALAIALGAAMALGSPHYRCDGKGRIQLTLRADHPMFHELGIVATCPMPIDRVTGWWPDVFPEPSGR
jgi:hypothetical protein